MAPLPAVRLEEVPPFMHVGLYCFGPFLVKEGRRTTKKYGMLITCIASRAVHIEVLDDMSTDAFLSGIRCVVAIRGPIQSIRCDRCTNFVGATRELKAVLQELNEKDIYDILLSKQCEFVFNSPDSSHMGGVWERHIRTIKSILDVILHANRSKLNGATLRTFLYEVMAIINGRPHTAQNLNSPDSPEPLTPNHLLTMKYTIVTPPPGSFSVDDTYLRKRWRHVQYLTNEFWNRWRKEYLLMLQQRQKWNQVKRSMAVGDVVLIKDIYTFRGNWSLGKVTELISSTDGLVRRVKLLI